jgi:hypothetical protein
MREEDALRKKSMEHHSRKQAQQARKKRFTYLVKRAAENKQTKRDRKEPLWVLQSFSAMKP